MSASGPPPDDADALAGAVESLRDQLQRVRRERDAAARRAEEAERRLAAVYATPTWRAGKAVVLPLRAVRLLVRRARALRRRLRGPRAPRPPGGAGAAAAHLRVTEHAEGRDRYEQALRRDRFTGSGRAVAFAVSTVDLDAARGDLYAALGLGTHLADLGYEVVYLPPARWYDPPSGLDVYVALLAERDLMVDPSALPDGCLRLAWVRNLTERWLASPSLPLYDGVLCTSEPSRRAVRRGYRGPVELLPLAVDERLFAGPTAPARTAAVATVNGFNRSRDLFAALQAARVDFPLALFGHGIEEHQGLAPYAQGPVSYFALPSLYAQAAVVLDDQQDSNRLYGHVNSRVFESLAAGALPVTNSAAGLRDLGLEAVPTYESPDALADAVRSQLSDGGSRTALVAELRDRVLRDHTFGARAGTFDRFVGGLLDGRLPRASGPVIGFTPDYRVTNPFQDMCYARAADRGMTAVHAEDPVRLADQLARAGRPFVYHVHWTATILGPAEGRRDANARCDRFLADLDEVRRRGGRIVWTVHNVLPHECAHPDVERRLRAGLAERADVVHVMCAETVELVAEHYPLPSDRVRVVPHGSYVDVYPNIVDERQARLELGLGKDELVLLCLGGIRPYKGIDELLDAFDVVARERADYRLVVAGRPGRFRELDALRRRCEAHPQVAPYFEAVDDLDLQLYFNACDVVVLPHREVLNSGGLQLAWSFGRPVLAPRRGCLAGQVDDAVGRTFVGHDGLVDALRQAGDLRTVHARRAAFERAAAYPYTAMSRDILDLIDSLVTHEPVGEAR